MRRGQPRRVHPRVERPLLHRAHHRARGEGRGVHPRHARGAALGGVQARVCAPVQGGRPRGPPLPRDVSGAHPHGRPRARAQKGGGQRRGGHAPLTVRAPLCQGPRRGRENPNRRRRRRRRNRSGVRARRRQRRGGEGGERRGGDCGRGGGGRRCGCACRFGRRARRCGDAHAARVARETVRRLVPRRQFARRRTRPCAIVLK
mmetsp:Transcript_3398/g.12205  ORF Transcript_3398/g.12205 Transcript_3398/m.12205 type:complete len:203 (+) Transcript_3398:1821-2429(+)